MGSTTTNTITNNIVFQFRLKSMLFDFPKVSSLMLTNITADIAADHYNNFCLLFKLMAKQQLTAMTNLIY